MYDLVGTRHTETIVVGENTAISFLGHADGRVLGTPWMILWMEIASRNAIKPLLPAGWDSVGTTVNIRHVMSAPMGCQVQFHAEVVEQNRKRVLFRVEAVAPHGVIGDGTHERALIDIERFAERAAGFNAVP